MPELGKAQIQQIIRDFITQMLEKDEKERIMQESPMDEQSYREQLMGYDEVEDHYKRALAYCDPSEISSYVDRWVLAPAGIEMDKESYSYKVLCREMLKAQLKVVKVMRERELGIYPEEDLAPSAAGQASSGTEARKPTVLLEDLIAHYFEENRRADNWGPRTVKEYLLITLLQLHIINLTL